MWGERKKTTRIWLENGQTCTWYLVGHMGGKQKKWEQTCTHRGSFFSARNAKEGRSLVELAWQQRWSLWCWLPVSLTMGSSWAWKSAWMWHTYLPAIQEDGTSPLVPGKFVERVQPMRGWWTWNVRNGSAQTSTWGGNQNGKIIWHYPGINVKKSALSAPQDGHWPVPPYLVPVAKKKHKDGFSQAM